MATFGQDLRCGYYDRPAAERMAAIRAAGFDDVMLWWADGGDDGGRYERLALAEKNGLRVRTAHFPITESAVLWAEGLRGDAYTDALIAALGECGVAGVENLVIHVTQREGTPPAGPIGVARMARALAAAERAGVNIAVENARALEYNRYLYARLDSPHLGFCFDSGHAHCFTPGDDPLGEFGARLCTTHLHDNFGPARGDLHNALGDGSIDVARLFRRLRALRPTAYNLESENHPGCAREALPMEDYLRDCLACLRRYVAEAENASES